jgi:hypothetical protein
LKNHQKETSGYNCRNLLRVTGEVLALSSLMLATPLMAADYSFSGESKTILRMKTTLDKKDIYPLYEYLRLNMTNNLSDGSGVSFQLGAWGRLDLADKTTGEYSDADLQYAYLSYRAAKNNTVVNLGRQFVTEGVAAEKLDGLYLRNDFAKGIPKYYNIGLSALKSEDNDKSRYREEEGLDIWVHPIKQIDLTGRSSYNSITNGWMEHAYTVSIIPLDNLRISADISNINYRDYFFNMTTAALRLISGATGIMDPDEELFSTGASVAFTPLKNLTVAADYRNYDYKVAGSADYFGGKLTYSQPESFSVGFGAHRMEGNSDRLRYSEYRLFAGKKIGHADLTADLISISYDRKTNGLRNSYAVSGSAGYEINSKLKVGADLEYSKSPVFDNEVRGLVKITYLFDTKRSEGGGKSEK